MSLDPPYSESRRDLRHETSETETSSDEYGCTTWYERTAVLVVTCMVTTITGGNHQYSTIQ